MGGHGLGVGQVVLHQGNTQKSGVQPPFLECLTEGTTGDLVWLSPRLHGSYENLHFGYIADAFVDLTGGVVTCIDLHSTSSNLLMMVKTAAKVGSLMACATPAGVSRTRIPFSWFKPGPFS